MNRRLLFAVVAVAASGCGFGPDEDVREIAPDDLFGLDETTTTSTSTTTTTTTTTIPPPVDSGVTTVPPTPATTATSTTVVLTEPVELFFIDGRLITPATRNLAADPTLSRVLEVLQSGPPEGDAGFGLRSAVPEGVVNTVTRAGGVATVDLVGDVYERIDAADELPAIAQIVLTLTRQPGVGQVRFTLDGEPLQVRFGSNLVSRPGEPVSSDDYAELLATDGIGDGPPLLPPPATSDSSATSTPEDTAGTGVTVTTG